MRIDLKTVKDKTYVQYVDTEGNLHHLGSAKDWDSWLTAAYLWDADFQEYYEDYFEVIKAKASRFIELDDAKKEQLWKCYNLYPLRSPEAIEAKVQKVADKSEEYRSFREFARQEYPELTTTKKRERRVVAALRRDHKRRLKKVRQKRKRGSSGS